MNPTKQFWTLVKFQYLLNPIMWVLPLLVGVSSLIPLWIQRNSSYASDLSFYFQTNQTFFFVGIFGSMILGPDKFQFNRMRTMTAYSGSEFILTRAIDRPLLYRAKSFLVYALILALPICTALYFLSAPQLIVKEYSDAGTRQVLAHVPGSVISPNHSSSSLQPSIIIPYGGFLISEFHLWIFVLAILALQIAVAVLAPFKFGKSVFWTLCYLGLLVPAFLPLYQIKSHSLDRASLLEAMFYFFTHHQVIIWSGTLVAIVACQFLCERNFSRQEH